MSTSARKILLAFWRGEVYNACVPYSTPQVAAGLFIVAFWVVIIASIGLLFLKAAMCIYLDHHDARKYRELLKLAESSKTSGASTVSHWTMVYKDGRATKTLHLPGATESEAMQRALKSHQISFDRIVSLTKN